MRHVVQHILLIYVFALACEPSTHLAQVFQGWTQAQALGGRTPVPHATGLTTTTESVTLGWNAMCRNLMGRTFDKNNNYRCPYVGPGNNGGYYNINIYFKEFRFL